MKPQILTSFACLGLALTACKGAKDDAQVEPTETKAALVKKADGIERLAFNRIAAELATPIFWIKDANNDKAVDADELAVLWGIDDSKKSDWVKDSKLTEKFWSTYAKMLAHGKAQAVVDQRLTLLQKELSQGRQTLLLSDFVKASEEDRAIVTNVLEAAVLIEKIHAKQNGVADLAAKIPAGETVSKMVFYRNQGPWCAAPATENDANCNALASKPSKISGLYPASIQKKGFCDELAKRKDADQLMHQFHVVRGEGDSLKAVPYTEEYKTEMTAISKKLIAAADAIKSDKEAAFQAYLRAAAQAFVDNNWQPADEAWSKMNVNNSKWYLRIGPDEVYFEPCSRKAGFHVSFASINQDSLRWQNKLDPVKKEMEQTLAELAGAPYKARDVSFHLPDFINIVLNAGDSRSPHGATIGQSLPNWGPVANEGRGRTVAMTNLYNDPDSKSELKKQAESLFCKATMDQSFTLDSEPLVMSTVLHEAAHNLGPAHEYKVNGKTASQIFGGPLASMLEELKSQTAALYFTTWLAEKKLITKKLADQAHNRDIVWGFGHISRGMYTAEGKPKAYSQLAAIQFGFLMKEGAITWNADEVAANGKDKGCFVIDHAKFDGSINTLMKKVGGIKARGDKKLALELREEFVGGVDAKKPTLDLIRERWLRAPKASFVYAVDL